MRSRHGRVWFWIAVSGASLFLAWRLWSGAAGMVKAQSDFTSYLPYVAMQVTPTPTSPPVYYLPFIAVAPPPTISPCGAPPLAPIYWDPRVGPYGTLDHYETVRIVPAVVGHCDWFWRVVVVKLEDYYESGGNHNIYLKILDENGNRVYGTRAHLTSEWAGLSEYPTEKEPGDMCDCNFDYPMYGDAYAFTIEDAYPSDQMAGMVMPLNQHVNYRIAFQRTLNP